MSLDRAAAEEVVRRTGQMGVPVTVAGDEVIVGFDRPRLERLAARLASSAPRPRLGLLVKDWPGAAEVGGARPGSPAELAGLRAGELVEALDGRPIRTAADLEMIAAQLRAGAAVEVQFRRGGERHRTRLEL